MMEPLYGYPQTSILSCIFYQVLGFSGRIVTHQGLFCMVMLLQTQCKHHCDKTNMQLKEVTGLMSKTKSVKVQHTLWKVSLPSLHN